MSTRGKLSNTKEVSFLILDFLSNVLPKASPTQSSVAETTAPRLSHIFAWSFCGFSRKVQSAILTVIPISRDLLHRPL